MEIGRYRVDRNRDRSELQKVMRTSEFDYELPTELIAQTPVEPRDSSRLMVVHRATGKIEHRFFREIGSYLHAGDLLVGNNSRVIPARLFGRKVTGGQCEILLLEKVGELSWNVLIGGRRTKVGTVIEIIDRQRLPSEVTATISAELEGAERTIQFNLPIEAHWQRLGHTPLPPYIHQQVDDSERYQTVYARPDGSAAAPTAGLHFTPDLLWQLREQEIGLEQVTLHVGLGTFQSVSAEWVADHPIHSEQLELKVESAERINQTKLHGNRVIAIGTTSVRVLETAAWKSMGYTGSLRQISTISPPAACPWKPVAAYRGTTDLYIYPGYAFRVVDALITNFHLPQSSLLMLVAAFAGYDLMRAAYDTAIAEKYRFFSFGDAMLIL